MVRRKFIGFVAVLLSCVASPVLRAQPMAYAPRQAAAGASSDAHDGHWWSRKTSPYKEGFMAGYHAGLVNQSGGRPTSLKGISTSQLIDGVDKFYKDFRNQKIVIDDVLTYVVEEIQGVPDEKLAAQLLKLRQAAAGRGEE